MITLEKLVVKLGLDSSEFQQGLGEAQQRASSFSRTFDGLATVGGGIVAGLAGVGVAAIGASVGIGAFVTQAAMAAGRVEQLAGVNRVLADNLGISDSLVRQQVEALRLQGIEAASAEAAIAKMMQANLDLSRATELATLAQDAAVIAGENSTEAYDGIMHGIITLQPEVLRMRGLIVDKALAFEQLAESLGKTVSELTPAEQQTAMMNAALEAGTKIQGAYDESMKNPVKQLGSMKRLVNDVMVAVGGPFLDAFSSVIAGGSDFVKWIRKAVSEGGALRPMLEQMGTWFSIGASSLGEFTKGLIESLPVVFDLLKSIGEVFRVVFGFQIPEHIDESGNAMAATGQGMAQGWQNPLIAIAETGRSMAEQWEKFHEPVKTMADKIRESIGTIIAQVNKFKSFLENNRGVIIAVLAAVGVAVVAFGISVAGAAITAMSGIAPVIAIMLVVAGIAYLLYEAWNSNFGGIQEIVKNFWENNLKPAFEQVRDFLAVAIPAALAFLSNLWTNVLLPALTAVWSFISQYIFPVFEQVWNILAVAIPAALAFLSNLWTNVLLPALNAVWSFLSKYIIPIFVAVSNFAWAVLGLALRVLGGYIQNILIPVWKKIFEWINDKIIPVVLVLAKWLGEKLKPAFDGIKIVIGFVVDLLKKLADGIRNIKLPDWLTPGSPTPFEIGLLGIADALKKIDRIDMPEMFDIGVSTSRAGDFGGNVNGGGGAPGFAFYGNTTFQVPNGVTAERMIEIMRPA